MPLFFHSKWLDTSCTDLLYKAVNNVNGCKASVSIGVEIGRSNYNDGGDEGNDDRKIWVFKYLMAASI